MKQIKKSRSINWSENEKKVLKMLILERAEVLENKDTTTKTTQLKKHVWGEVLTRFNAFGPIKRDLPQLQNQWRNMKNRGKKSGGGSLSEDKEVMEPIPLEFSIDSNVLDSNTFHNQSDMVLSMQAILPTQPPNNKAEKNKIHNKQCCSDDHEHELFLLEKKAREQAIHHQKEEHECKMKYEREAREQAIHHQKEEHECKIKYEREMYERRMNILALEVKYWKNKASNL